MLVRVAIVASVLAGCGKSKDPGSPPATEVTAAPECARTHAKGPLRWFEDNWSDAVACAKARKLPIVLDLWAPWCHTCISMQTTVLLDPSFAAKADRFIWVALDADKPENAAPVGRYASSAMPTFYVIGPDEQVLARFVGAATLAQFHAFVDSGARVAAGGIAAADTRLLAAERALANKELATAEAELTAALAAAPLGWPRRAEAVASLQLTHRKRGQHAACIALSAANMDQVGKTATATNFWSTAIECAKHTSATEVRDRAIANLATTLADAQAPLSVDDRAEALGYLRNGLDDAGKPDEARAVAEQLRALLDDAWTKAATPLERMTHLWLRAEVYAYLQRPLDLVADYEKLAGELPGEYDPPARLGWLYFKAGKLVEAAAWTDKALALVYGPRKARLLGQRAEIAAAAGDKVTERAMRQEAVKQWESLPPGQQNAEALAKARAALDEMK